MRILAFDPGMSMGWSVFKDDQYIRSGFYNFASDVPIGSRLVDLQESIGVLIHQFKPELIATEAVNRVGGAATFNKYAYVLPAIFAFIQMEAYKNNIRILEISPATVKKQVTGSGKADKKQMLMRVNELLYELRNLQTVTTKNHNEADAIGIGYTAYLIAQNNWEIPQKGKNNV